MDQERKKMDFLKGILGDDLYKQVETAINAYNGNEANKDKTIKIANLGSGEYVGKGKFEALNDQLKGKDSEIAAANALIADLKKGNKDNEGLQAKITDYESKIQDLQAEIAKTKLENAIKVALLEEKATDIDYLTFKLNANNEKLELDEAGKIKGWDDKLSGLKTQFPNMFEGNGSKSFKEHRLPDQNDDGKQPEIKSLADALRAADEANE